MRSLSLRLCLRGCLLPLLFFCPSVNSQTSRSVFEVAAVKPSPPEADPKTGSWSIPGKSQFTATNVSLSLLIQLAYNVDDSQITHKPAWLDSRLYDVAAKAENGVPLTREDVRPYLQDLLQQRFHLALHTETRSMGGYKLVIAKGGAHLTPTTGDHFPGFRTNVSAGQMRGFNWSMPQLAKYLTSAAHFPVVDQTGLAGSYDIGFSYDPDPQDGTLNEALQRATGLSLESAKVSVEILVIDSADPVPTAN